MMFCKVGGVVRGLRLLNYFEFRLCGPDYILLITPPE